MRWRSSTSRDIERYWDICHPPQVSDLRISVKYYFRVISFLRIKRNKKLKWNIKRVNEYLFNGAFLWWSNFPLDEISFKDSFDFIFKFDFVQKNLPKIILNLSSNQKLIISGMGYPKMSRVFWWWLSEFLNGSKWINHKTT